LRLKAEQASALGDALASEQASLSKQSIELGQQHRRSGPQCSTRRRGVGVVGVIIGPIALFVR
ncbi:MAG TPA: hypothetical protein VKQ70_17780, partial [Caulobacteraceae bacterium]|nr:hypothetical protein [Caulobacteraceae bacterium]